ncbi:putative lim homeobox protein [Schistosoma mansoni]|uniref:putative lim homeobox protein n=1 Tax=Schistosoma mansoni TaxID=6183 RepID=UPI00022DC8ED|nr:putative lim homeobox protein [Schistosoma mansoni]|eukprot:XP_018647779.1 putative lim homeobox protein [Schistosoma mansoni]
MSTEYTVLDSSISSHPYSSNKQFVDDNQNNLMNNFISDIYSTSLFEQFPFSMKNFSSTGTSLPTNSPNLSSSLPLSSITVRKLSNMEIIQENDIHNINFQLYPNKYKLPLLSTHQLTDNHIHSISTIETNTPSTSTTTMDPLIKTQSNESNKSIIKRTKTYQKLIKDCTGCNQPIYEKIYLGLSDGQLWHMNCLNCNTCGKCLDKETSCFNRYGQIYCRKDYEQIFGSFKSRPVCTYCKQLISSNELIVRSINQLIFHSDCFCCNICHRIMKCGDRYELDNVSHQPICWEHYQQSHHHQLDSFLSCTDLCEGIKCLRESDHRDPGKLKELSGQIYSADGNTNLNFVHASDVLSIRDTDPDIEDLPTESSSRTDFLEHGNKLNLIDYGVNKQQPKSSVSSVIDKHKDEKYSRFNSYSIPLIGKDSSAIELLPNCLSHKPIHYLPPLSHHLLQDNSSYSPCNLFNQPLRKLESDSSNTKNPLELNKSIDSNVLIQHVQQQKRNRKRRSGIHQVFDKNVCVHLLKHHQLRTMKAYFNINHNPDVKDLKVLTEKTGLSKRVLQVWFQNARAKYRRNLVRQENTSTSVNNHINNSLTSGLITSSNCGSSEMIELYTNHGKKEEEEENYSTTDV